MSPRYPGSMWRVDGHCWMLRGGSVKDCCKARA